MDCLGQEDISFQNVEVIIIALYHRPTCGFYRL